MATAYSPDRPIASCDIDPQLCTFRRIISQLELSTINPQYFIDFKRRVIGQVPFCTRHEIYTPGDGGGTIDYPLCTRRPADLSVSS